MTEAELEERNRITDEENANLEKKARLLAQQVEVEAKERQISLMKCKIDELLQAHQTANENPVVLNPSAVQGDEAATNMLKVLEMLQNEQKEREREEERRKEEEETKHKAEEVEKRKADRKKKEEERKKKKGKRERTRKEKKGKMRRRRRKRRKKKKRMKERKEKNRKEKKRKKWRKENKRKRLRVRVVNHQTLKQ